VYIFNTKEELHAYLSPIKRSGKRIGLVPTMGALHKGHLSLLNFIQDECDIRVCSIFVNPTQFNNSEDLEKYPRPIEADIQKLKQVGCDVLFLPEVEEMYPEKEEWHIELNGLDRILEGAFREGHYQGVTQIVKKLFDAVEPHVACFGQKDYQQYLVIREMVRLFKLPTEILLCPTIRDADGLALSSRNVRLSDDGRNQALFIFKALDYLRTNCTCSTLEQSKEKALAILSQSTGIEVEYFEICDPVTLRRIDSCTKTTSGIALIAAWVDGVRLIDNMFLQITA